jgi:hypothetical protein
VIFQVEVFWVVMPCGVMVGYRRLGGPCCLRPSQHYTASQPRRPRLEAAVNFLREYLNLRYVRRPFENFVHWRKCAAVMQRKAVTVSLCISHRLLLYKSGALLPVHELFKRPLYIRDHDYDRKIYCTVFLSRFEPCKSLTRDSYISLHFFWF